MLAFPRRLASALFVPILLASLLAGCGGDKNKPVIPAQILSQDEADDIAQQAGAMIATNLGGWMYEVRSSFNTVPINGAQTLRRGPGLGLERDTTIANNGINYAINYMYQLRSGEVIATWDTSAVGMDVESSAQGTLVSTGSDRHNGDYKHHGEFSLEDIHAGEDTLVTFSGFMEDTSFATIRNFTSGEIKYYFIDSFVDFLFEMKRYPVNLYPVTGECTFTLDADRLHALDRNTSFRNVLVDVDVAFDGTVNPSITVTEDPGDPRTIFHYKMNLDDGTVVRAP